MAIIKIDSSLLRMIERNLPFLRELTLDGEIARQDWIDRERIERALTPERLLSGTSLEDTLNLVVAEAWLRAWRRR